MEALDLNDSSYAEQSIPNEDDIRNGEWDIDFDKEKMFWKEFCIKKFIYIPNLCLLYKHNTFRINEKIKKDVINPFYFKCSNKSCKKKVI